MTFHSPRLRPVSRLIAACAIAAAGGGLALTAAPAPVRLVGVSSQTSGRTAAVLIEATEPVAYAVSRPDPLTVLVDLRNVSVGDASSQVVPGATIAGVTVEQASAVDGRALARVRVALTSPATYQVHSARNTIRLDLEPAAGPVRLDAPMAVRTTSAARPDDEPAAVPPATVLQRVRAKRSGKTTIVTLGGDGRIEPSTLTEATDLPRRLVLDFPNVTSNAAAETKVDGDLVKQVRVAVNSRAPLVTRVVMDIAPEATYHVERAGADGRDLSVVFEPRTGTALLAPAAADPADAQDADDDVIPLDRALANAASLIPPDDPIEAITGQAPAPAPAAQAPAAQPPAAKPSAPKPPAPQSTQTQRPATPSAAIAQAAAQPPAHSVQIQSGTEKKYVGHPISMDFQDADLRSVLRTFAEISGLNMVIDPQVQGRVDIVLNEVPWDQALDTILRGNKLGWTVDGTIVRIAPLSVLAEEQSDQRKLADAKALAGELRVQTFSLSYAKADQLSPLLTRSALSQRGQIQVDGRTNTLIISDLPDHLQTAASLIATLDQPEPQVEVEARVVQTTRDFARALGVQWGFNGRATPEIGNTTGLAFPNQGTLGGRVGTVTQGPTDPRGAPGQNTSTAVNLGVGAASSAIGLALGSVNGAFNLDVALSALENSGKGRVLSTPRLTTQNNVEAEVAQGIQIPIQTVANNTVTVQFRDAVLLLKVTPQITAAGTVIMQITIENATPDFARQINGIPPINTQRANTRVQVNDGATTVIGGIFVSQEQSSIDRTPLLHRIPLLGWLFKRESVTDSSRELLIFITPRILKS
ncbi:MAG TPA: type IV pilus secretin PilQ [Vicinamibacterales bacterium]|nr:type IV pilus secretin PilQ [Vicinamibacterales bacterium]